MDVVKFLTVLFYIFHCISCSDNNIKRKMEENKIVPDIVDTAPCNTLSVKYNNIDVKLGNEFTPTQVKNSPQIIFDSNDNNYYTLLMIDPDAPSRVDPKLREVLHWFVGNIQGSNLKTGDEITAYLGSGPPKGTGLHRYVFLLFEQSGKINFDEPKTPNNSRAHRFNFSTRKFIEKYNLGVAIAGNFFVAQWDEYVDQRNKNITNN